MADEQNRPKYNAFIDKLGPVGSLIIVKEIDGIKYFSWITILELKAKLGI